MKKLHGILVLMLLLALLASPIAVLASDISGARYYGTIIVSNNSTATTNVAVNCTISTQALIDGGYLNSSANNCVVRSSAGADLPVMPSVNASYPWCIWVPSIGANSHLSDILYTANSTGGEIRYFPGPEGMTTADSASLELGDNFTIEQKGWVDTDAGTTNWETPSGASGHTNSGQAINDNTTDYSTWTGTNGNWGAYLTVTQSAVLTDGLRYYSSAPDAQVGNIDVDFYYGGAWHHAYVGAPTLDDYATVSINATRLATQARLRFYATATGSIVGFNDIDFSVLEAPTLIEKTGAFVTYVSNTGNITSHIDGGSSVSATGISSGEHTVKTQQQYPAELKENYDDNNGSGGMKGDTWYGQTFTPSSDFTIGSIQLELGKFGNPAGDLIVSLRNTSGGLPTGSDLTSVSMSAGSIAAAPAWYSCNITPYDLSSGTQYAILARVPDGEGSNYIAWLAQTAGAYAGGSGFYSTNGGSSFITFAYDFSFRTYEGGFFVILIDGELGGIDRVNMATVPDTSANWTYYENMGNYWEYTEVSVNGTQVQYIDWEYDTIFQDSSAFDNDATPTFRTTSSDADVSAVLTSFLPISEARAPAYALSEAPAFIEDTPVIVSEWAVTPPAGTFPLAGVIAVVANATDTPAQLPLLIIAAFVIIACSLAVSATMRRYGSGSLIVKSLVITALMGVFIAIGNFGIDFWMLVVFLIIAVALSMGSKQVGWQ